MMTVSRIVKFVGCRGRSMHKLRYNTELRTVSVNPNYKGINLGFRLVMKKKFDIEDGTLKDNKELLESLSRLIN